MTWSPVRTANPGYRPTAPRTITGYAYAPAIALLKTYSGHPRMPEGKLMPRISNQKPNAYLKLIADKASISKHLTYHCARHTFATTVPLTNGVPIETVGQMLGHKKRATTQLYARVTDTKMMKDMVPVKEKYQTPIT